MSFKVGENVVYISGEICLIEDIVKRSFDGVNELEYYKLSPINTAKSTYYIPCGNYQTKMRHLLTKDEILELIEEMPHSDADWCEDKKERKTLFQSVLKSDDYHKIIKMMHSLYIHRESQLEQGKKLSVSDERAMNDAEHLVYQEFAFVLGIEEREVEGFIEERLRQ